MVRVGADEVRGSGLGGARSPPALNVDSLALSRQVLLKRGLRASLVQEGLYNVLRMWEAAANVAGRVERHGVPCAGGEEYATPAATLTGPTGQLRYHLQVSRVHLWRTNHTASTRHGHSSV